MDIPQELVRVMLEDTQGSLAAALARIEAFRMREKGYAAEISQLRKQCYGHQSADQLHEATKESSLSSSLLPASSTDIAAANTSGYGFTGLSNEPLYVGQLATEQPVNLLVSNQKVPVSLIITKDRLEFAEVKARVSNTNFIGITAATGYDKSKNDDPLSVISNSRQRSNGTWSIWHKEGETPRNITFEASQETRQLLHKYTERWTAKSNSDNASEVAHGGEIDLSVPRALVFLDPPVVLRGEPSSFLSPTHVAAISSALPALQRLSPWSCAYSTARHGISLATLYRKVSPTLPSLLVIKDFGGHIFGCYTTEGWKVSPRFYGSGETFVFQLEPHRVCYPWRSSFSTKNDFFMYSTPECAAVGGGGHFSIWIDAELNRGSSGPCATFGSPCLAFREEFQIQVLEVWQIVPH